MPPHGQEDLREEHVPQLLPEQGEDEDGLQLWALNEATLLQRDVPKLLSRPILPEEKGQEHGQKGSPGDGTIGGIRGQQRGQ